MTSDEEPTDPVEVARWLGAYFDCLHKAATHTFISDISDLVDEIQSSNPKPSEL